MKALVLFALLGVLAAFAGDAVAQDAGATKVAIINIQAAIASSTDGQRAATELRDRFAPKREELEKQQREIADLQNQLRNQEKTLSDEARTRLLRSIDDKTRAFNRSNEDATTEFQQAEQDAINEIGRKMLEVISEHAQKNGYALVIDVSSPQTPVLYASSGIDITETIIRQYDATTAKAPAGSSGQSAGTALESPKPAEASTSP